MISRVSICLAVLFAFALVAQPATAQDDALYDEITITITPGQISDFRLNCPDGYFAAAGGVRDVDGGNVRVVRSQASANGKSWEFIVDHRNAPGPTVVAWIICLKIEEPAKKGQVVRQAHNVVKQKKEIPQQSAVVWQLKCPKGRHPTGWGIDIPTSAVGRAVISSGVGSAAGQMDFLKAKPSTGQVEIVALNVGPATEGTASAVCEAREATSRPKKGRKGSRFRRQIRVVRKTDKQDVKQGNNDGIRKRCGPRPKRGVARTAAFSSPESISTWWDLGNGGTTLFTSFADGKSEGTWNIFSAFDRTVDLFLLCRSVETRWKRIK